MTWLCGEIKMTIYTFRRRSRSVSEEEEEEEDGEFDRFSDWTFTVHLQYYKHIFS